MYGSSRASLAELHEVLAAGRTGPGFAGISADLLAVAGLLDGNSSLRSTLGDSGIPAAARSGIVTELLGDQLSPEGLALLSRVVGSRWSHDRDIVEALETLGAQAALMQAQTDGTLDAVEDDLFRFGRALESSDELQLTLTDPSLAGDRKAAVVRDLLGSGSTVTSALLTHVVAHLGGRSPIGAVDALSQLAAAQREQLLAEVTSAVSLTEEQQARLIAALHRLTGRDVHLNIDVSPEVLGGLVVSIGDEVIDGSISARLEQARRALAE